MIHNFSLVLPPVLFSYTNITPPENQHILHRIDCIDNFPPPAIL